MRRQAQRGEPVKNGLNTGIAGIRRNGKIGVSLLTRKGPGPYKHHSFGAPSALRRDDAPLKLLTMCGSDLREEVGGSNFVGFSVHREVGNPGFPGCLTSESEERETWTAESLRTAPFNGEAVERETFLRCGHGRDFGGQRFRSSLMSISASNRRCGQ